MTNIKLNNLYILMIIIIIATALKIGLWYFLRLELNLAIGEGNDSNLYHDYAVGNLDDGGTGIWPLILRELYLLGFYNRNVISFINLIIAVFFLPLLIYKILKKSKCQDSLILPLIIYTLLSPTLYFYSFDIYRDIIMFLIFASSVYFYQASLDNKLLIVVFLITAFLALGLRSYLGVSILAAYIFSNLISFNKNLKKFFFLGLVGMGILYSTSLLDPLAFYRGEEGFVSGGSSFGISFISLSLPEFYLNFFKSLLFQIFGLYITNSLSILVFFLETAPFIFALIYILNNTKQFNKICNFLFFFFVMYTSIVVIGNDNLGTSLRLRFPSYLSVFLIAIIVKNRKLNVRNFRFSKQ